MLTGVSPPAALAPPKCDNSRTGNTVPSQAEGRSEGTGTVLSFIVPVPRISYLFLQSHSPDPFSYFYTLRAGTGCPALGGDDEGLLFIEEPEPFTGTCHHPFRRVVHLAQVGKDDLRHVFTERLQAAGSSGVGQVPPFGTDSPFQ